MARANVAVPPINVTPLRDLQFGNVLPGTPASVAPTDGASGQYRATGGPLAQATLSFSLPSVLSTTGPVQTMAITFPSTYARAGWINNPNFLALSFDPTAGTTIPFSPATLGSTLYVWIGGQVSPSVSQQAGLYQGTIVLTVAYTGS